MDIGVEERAFAPVSKELVDREDPRGVEIVGMLEHQRDLTEPVPHGSGPILKQDRSSRCNRLASRRSARARGEAPPPAATDQPLLPTLGGVRTPASQDPRERVLVPRAFPHEWMRLVELV